VSYILFKNYTVGTDVTLSSKRTRINQLSNEERGGNYEPVTCHLAKEEEEEEEQWWWWWGW
jgi:hypothetical protein